MPALHHRQHRHRLERHPDPKLDNNAASDPTTVDTLADVALTKSLDTPTPVLAGTEATFTLQASNSGPSDAADVAVADTLPQHLEYVSATGDGWTCAASGNDVVCTRPTVPAVPPGAPVPPITLVARSTRPFPSTLMALPASPTQRPSRAPPLTRTRTTIRTASMCPSQPKPT